VYVDFCGVLTLTDVAARIERAYQRDLSGTAGRWFDGVRRTLQSVEVGARPLTAGVSLRPGAAALQDPAHARDPAGRGQRSATGRRLLPPAATATSTRDVAVGSTSSRTSTSGASPNSTPSSWQPTHSHERGSVDRP